MPPRTPLTVDRITDAAVELVEREGHDALALGAVAAALGVRAPSLYNHVDGLDEIRRRLRVRAIDALGDALQRATVGRSGDEAVRTIARAYRAFALDHPGLYAATVPSSEVADADVQQAGARVVETVVAALSGFHLDPDEAVHATRTLRAAVHGFVDLELAGGFGLAQSPSDTFDWMTELLAQGFRAGAEISTADRPTPSSRPMTGRRGR